MHPSVRDAGTFYLVVPSWISSNLKVTLVVQNGCWASNHHIYIPAGGEKEIEEGALALPFKDNFLVVTIFLHATGKNWVTWSQFSCNGELGNVGFVQDGYIAI